MTMPCDDVTRRVEAHRIEVFTGTTPRRRWSADDKARIVAESYTGAGTVCDVARRYGLAPTQLFTWRRDARTMVLPGPELVFAPVVVAPSAAEATPAKQPRRHRHPSDLQRDAAIAAAASALARPLRAGCERWPHGLHDHRRELQSIGLGQWRRVRPRFPAPGKQLGLGQAVSIRHLAD
jgi:transposase